MALFEGEFLKKLEYLSIVSKKVFQGQLMAQRRTMKLGSGVEFADHRQYTAGDDFRYLDWNLYARHDELLLKRFQEEEDLHVYLLLDCSASMAVGTPSKFDLARQVTAALAYIALADLDRVAVYSFGDSILQQFPLTRGKARIVRLMSFLEELQPSAQATRLSELTTEFVQRAPRRGLVILLSDLFDPDGFQKGLDVLRHHKFEPHVIQFHDQTEAYPSMLGDVELLDSETTERRRTVVTEAHLQRYRSLFQDFLKSIQDFGSAKGFGVTVSDGQLKFDQLILNMMKATH